MIYTVLLVDDEPLVLEGLKFMIDWQSYGFQVCGEASDGEDALSRIEELNPDLVVTDISMPVMDGLSLIDYCTNVLNSKSQFVILSGHDDFTYARQALTCGVLNYWLKPIDAEEIHASLMKLQSDWSSKALEHSEGAQSKALPLGAAWSLPEADDSLFEAEDCLLLAIENGDKAKISNSAKQLCMQLQLSLAGEVESSKVFLSNLLLEISWKLLEGEVDHMAEEGVKAIPIPIPIVPNRLDDWESILTTYAHQVAEQLMRRESTNKIAWEAAKLVRERYNEPLQLQTIAKELHFQPAYLGQMFKKQLGISFLDYVHRTRVEAACKLLRRTGMKIADVAKTVGYVDPEQFSAKFKQWMNMTPSQYKNR